MSSRDAYTKIIQLVRLLTSYIGTGNSIGADNRQIQGIGHFIGTDIWGWLDL